MFSLYCQVLLFSLEHAAFGYWCIAPLLPHGSSNLILLILHLIHLDVSESLTSIFSFLSSPLKKTTLASDCWCWVMKLAIILAFPGSNMTPSRLLFKYRFFLSEWHSSADPFLSLAEAEKEWGENIRPLPRCSPLPWYKFLLTAQSADSKVLSCSNQTER